MSTSLKPQAIIHTDGACSGNPGRGGWAAIVRDGSHEEVLQGGSSLTTNNRMELRAAINGLYALERSCQVIIYTDSQYVRRGITEWLPNWIRNDWRTSRKGRVKNQDLWRALVQAQRPHDVDWRWVKAHFGDALNQRADALAVEARDTIGRRAPKDLENRP
jgi:ribonuclease HI